MSNLARQHNEHSDQSTLDTTPETTERFMPFDASKEMDSVMAQASPARLLQDGLNAQFAVSVSSDKKFDLKWTILGLTAFCGLFWCGVILAIA